MKKIFVQEVLRNQIVYYKTNNESGLARVEVVGPFINFTNIITNVHISVWSNGHVDFFELTEEEIQEYKAELL